MTTEDFLAIVDGYPKPNDKIRTTTSKVQGGGNAARRAASFVRGDNVIHKLFSELACRYKDIAGGYTRLLRTRIRVGDAAPMAYIKVDLGTADYFAIDVLLNCLTGLSSEYLGIQQIVFGGRSMGDWEEGMTDPEYGYKSFKI